MKVNTFTFTRDRLAYTTTCFESLQMYNKTPIIDHYILDNGSKDGTPDYLSTLAHDLKGLILSPRNVGLHIGTQLIANIMQPCDYVVKVDNDCHFTEPNVIKQLVTIARTLERTGYKYILSPRVEGIVNQPKRGKAETVCIANTKYSISPTGQIGGLCMLIPYSIFKVLRFNENLPLAKGLDSNICLQATTHGCRLAYVDNIFVTHYETTAGQAKKYPEYFKRKKLEERMMK